MKRTTQVFICVGIFVVMVSLLALGTQINFAPSTYNPAVEEAVAFEVCEPCLGSGAFTYEWDFDGDGVYEVSTEHLVATHTFAEAGFIEVGLKVVDASGLTAVRKKGILVGEVPLIAVRDLVEEDGATFILITFSTNYALTAPGLEETIPSGWQVEVAETEGALPPHMGNGILEILWADHILQGKTWTFSYWLYPSYGVGAPSLTGIASGYIAGKRVKATVCGDLSIPR